MRAFNSVALLLIVVGVALAVPAKKRIEKKSISNSLAAKAIEPVDQKLDEPAKLSDEALMEVAGENVERAKKQASTTFCVEVRHNKPTQVDCDELKNRPIPAPPAPAPVPEPQEPVPPPPPAPAPAPAAPVPQQQPEEFKYPLPCEPEMAAYYVNPPGEIVYAPTGNCAPHVPALLHVPSGGPGYAIPAGGVSGTPSVNVLHLPTGSFPAGGAAPGASGHPSIHLVHVPSGSLPSSGYGVGPTIHVSPSTGTGSGSPTVIPLHTTGGSGIVPAHSPSLLHVVHPSPLHHGIHHGGLPGHGHGLPLHGHGLPLHGHGGLPLNGHGSAIQCTCKSTTGPLAKSADGSPPSNEALAMKFLQDLQRNAQAQSAQSPASPMVVQVGPAQGQPGSPMMMVPAGSGSPAMAGKSEMRYMPLVRPMSNVQQQVVYQQQATSMNGMGGIGMPGYPMHGGYGAIVPGMYPAGMLRSKADCLQDSFGSSSQMMPQGLRLSRGEAEASGQEQSKQKADEKPEGGNLSPADIVEAIMSKQSDEPVPDENPRVARFLMEKNAESNNVLDEK